MYEVVAIFALLVFVYSALAGGLERTVFGGAVAFTACGLILGPLGLDVLELNLGAEGIRTLAELTLALVLFSDAANANFSVLEKNIRLPQRLLLIGLPLTILLGFGIGWVVFEGLSLIEVALLGDYAGADGRGTREGGRDQRGRSVDRSASR